MAKSGKVSITLEGYAPGVENDAEFLGVVFRKVIGAEMEIKDANKERGLLGKQKSELYGLKPLGAAAAPGKTLDKALIQTLWAKAKGDADRVARAYALRNPAHELTAEKVLSICSGVDQTAKDLLAQV